MEAWKMEWREGRRWPDEATHPQPQAEKKQSRQQEKNKHKETVLLRA
jgi:hypothetical protein